MHSTKIKHKHDGYCLAYNPKTGKKDYCPSLFYSLLNKNWRLAYWYVAQIGKLEKISFNLKRKLYHLIPKKYEKIKDIIKNSITAKYYP